MTWLCICMGWIAVDIVYSLLSTESQFPFMGTNDVSKLGLVHIDCKSSYDPFVRLTLTMLSGGSLLAWVDWDRQPLPEPPDGGPRHRHQDRVPREPRSLPRRRLPLHRPRLPQGDVRKRRKIKTLLKFFIFHGKLTNFAKLLMNHCYER